MVEVPHTLYLLFDVFNQVGLFGELSLVDALNRVHFILCGLELDLLDGKDEREGALAQSPKRVEVVALEDLTALLYRLLLLHQLLEL